MRALYGNMLVVAPISAPMLQMVPMPVSKQTRLSKQTHDQMFSMAITAPSALPQKMMMRQLLTSAWLTGAGDVVNAGAKVFDDSASATLDRQDAGQLADDILGRRPVGHLARQPHANDLGQSSIRV
jgi:hypothetical protein